MSFFLLGSMPVLAQAATETAQGSATAEVVLFWIFAGIALGAAIGVVLMRDIVHGALMLVVNLIAVAGLYLSLESGFLSIIQVLVYAGAIMVLFLFVIMLLGVGRDDLLTETHLRTRVLAVVGGALLAGALLFAFVGPYTGEASVCGSGGEGGVECVGLADAKEDGDDAGVAFLGRAMFTRYTLPFELSALLLTVATIGAVLLARRNDLAPDDIETIEDAGLDPLGDEDADEAGATVGGGDLHDEPGRHTDQVDDEREG